MFFAKSGKIEKGEKPCAICGYTDATQRRTARIVLHDGKIGFAGDEHDLCAFCIYIPNLVMASTQKMGKLIYAPDIAQKHVNELIRMVIAIRHHPQREQQSFKLYLQAADGIYAGLVKRTSSMEKIFGKDASEPEIFSAAITELTGGFGSNAAQKALQCIRFLPEPQQFSANAPEIVKAVFSEVDDPSLWPAILNEYKKAASSHTR
jgi:hypothetical protein